MARTFFIACRAFFYLAWLNLRHYALALCGVRLRLDPDYPGETRFRGDLIVDAVLEYRGYGLMAPWAVFLAWALPNFALGLLVGLWAISAWKRTLFYTTAYRFWTQAYNEAPGKSRNQTRYAEQLMLQLERRLKEGADYGSPEIQQLVTRSMEMQDLICGKPFKMPEPGNGPWGLW